MISKNDVIVVGAGGHAKVCIDSLRAMGLHVAYCVGTDPSVRQCLGIDILIGDEQLNALRSTGYSKAFIAIGANKLRQKLATKAIEQGFTLVNAIHPHAIISPSATIGSGVAVMAGAIVNADCIIGDLAIINTGATVDHDCQIACAAHIAPQCALAGGVIVGEHAFLGVGTKVIPTIKIGRNAVVGAGSVVINSIDADTVCVGVPATIIKNSKGTK